MFLHILHVRSFCFQFLYKTVQWQRWLSSSDILVLHSPLYVPLHSTLIQHIFITLLDLQSFSKVPVINCRDGNTSLSSNLQWINVLLDMTTLIFPDKSSCLYPALRFFFFSFFSGDFSKVLYYSSHKSYLN